MENRDWQCIKSFGKKIANCTLTEESHFNMCTWLITLNHIRQDYIQLITMATTCSHSTDLPPFFTPTMEAAIAHSAPLECVLQHQTRTVIY
jgi:hypothetical protein